LSFVNTQRSSQRLRDETALRYARISACQIGTLSDMETARAVDQKAVFVEVLPSHHDPMAIARHMKVAF
jgi:hypothetical protein